MSSTPLQKRRERVRHIRRRVVGAATALFLTTTGGIIIQLVSGHDPALAGQTATQASTSNGSAAANTASSGSSSSGTTSSGTTASGSSSSGSSSSDASSSGSATPVTTRAS